MPESPPGLVPLLEGPGESWSRSQPYLSTVGQKGDDAFSYANSTNGKYLDLPNIVEFTYMPTILNMIGYTTCIIKAANLLDQSCMTFLIL